MEIPLLMNDSVGLQAWVYSLGKNSNKIKKELHCL